MQPTARIPLQDWMKSRPIHAVIDALQSDGGAVRFVGGCVRDALAGRSIKDIDLATPQRPEDVIAKLEAAGIKVVPTGLKHGTVTAVSHGEAVEVTTLREDVETYGRHAKVEFTDCWVADAARRDLTINALSLTPDGELYDPFGGKADLEAGRVRFVGDARTRIAEDYLRLLRFFRFHAYYGQGAPDPEALAAAAALAPGLAQLSVERIHDELLKLLAAPELGPLVATMEATGILATVLPEGVQVAHALALIELERRLNLAPEALRRLAALVVGDDAVAEALGRRLRLSNAERLALVSSKRAARELTLRPDRLSLLQALQHLGPDAVRDGLLLAWAAEQADERPVDAAEIEGTLDEVANWQPITFPLAGRDAIARGIPSGPEVGKLLVAVEDWWLRQNRRPDRVACLSELERRIEASGEAE